MLYLRQNEKDPAGSFFYALLPSMKKTPGFFVVRVGATPPEFQKGMKKLLSYIVKSPPVYYIARRRLL